MEPILSAVHIFPVKSCAPLSVVQSEVQPRGLRWDRRWMVVDDSGRFLTGRETAALTLLRATPVDETDALHLEAPGMPALRLAPPEGIERQNAIIWDSTVNAALADAPAQAWISAFLRRPARLVYMDAAAIRPVDQKYAAPDDEVSFSDGYPLLLISQSALDHLNEKLAAPISMLRFRPNLVVANTAAHAEDGWRRVRIGEVEFDLVKPCVRCVFTTVDFERGERDPSGEPLRTLIGYRRGPKGVTFGQNLIARGAGVVRVGDEVTVLG